MKEMNKKIVILSCLLVFALLFAACGGSGDGGGTGGKLTSTEITEMDSEEFMSHIFNLTATASEDSSYAADSQNAGVEMSSDNARDYIINYDSGLLHMYTTPTGTVKMVYGAVDNDEMAPYILAASAASLDSGLSMETALEKVESLIADGSGVPEQMDDILLLITGGADKDYFMVICATLEDYAGDNFYEDRMGSNLDVVMYMAGLSLD